MLSREECDAVARSVSVPDSVQSRKEIIQEMRDHFDRPEKFGFSERGCVFYAGPTSRCVLGHYAHTQGVSDQDKLFWRRLQKAHDESLGDVATFRRLLDQINV